ncbi:hypothetical protein GCM10009817_25410 [Terrabacter lapilli]|uniref:Asp23/Gls24 family envelope stress response protein n=1 Tax=Terrabacter lapilli TaxID=436231 RepID=A0ABN2S9T1_9MICO
MTGEPGAAGRPAPTDTTPTDTTPTATPPGTVPTDPGSIDTAYAVAAAVRAVPGVVGLHSGAFGQAATYYPGRTVSGVQLRPEVTTVHLVLAWGVPVPATAALVREAVFTVTHGPVDVVVEDVTDPVGAMDRRVT